MKESQQYTKRPVTIEAIRWVRGENDWEVEVFANANRKECLFRVELGGLAGERCLTHFEVRTLEGTMVLETGNWLIRGVRGELYPCRDDIFQETYAPANMEAGHTCPDRYRNRALKVCEADLTEASRRPISRFRTLVDVQLEDWRKSGMKHVERFDQIERVSRRLGESGLIYAEYGELQLRLSVLMAAHQELRAEEEGWIR